MSRKPSFSLPIPALILATASVCTPPVASSQDLDVARIFRAARGSVVFVIALDQNRQPLAYGTGFFIDTDGTFATNYHVIQGATGLQVKLFGEDDVRAVDGVYGFDNEKDLAILKVGLIETKPIPLTTVRPVIGERIVAIGNPLGLEGSVSEGILSGIRQLKAGFTSPSSPSTDRHHG